MPTSTKKKPLGAWPDEQKHKEVQSPDEIGESSLMGSAPVTGQDYDIDEMASSVGIYTETSPDIDSEDPENPHPVNVAEEVEEAEDSRRPD